MTECTVPVKKSLKVCKTSWIDEEPDVFKLKCHSVWRQTWPLQPTLFDVLAYIAGGLGFIIHYIIPQLRKEMPWLCCAHPILASHERSQYEVRGKQYFLLLLYVGFVTLHLFWYLTIGMVCFFSDHLVLHRLIMLTYLHSTRWLYQLISVHTYIHVPLW